MRPVCLCLSEAERSGKPILSPYVAETFATDDFPGNVRDLQNILERTEALCENEIVEPHNPQVQGLTGPQAAVSNDQEAAKKLGLVECVDTMERDVLVTALDEGRWNHTAAAKRLGIIFRAMLYRLKN